MHVWYRDHEVRDASLIQAEAFYRPKGFAPLDNFLQQSFQVLAWCFLEKRISFSLRLPAAWLTVEIMLGNSFPSDGLQLDISGVLSPDLQILSPVFGRGRYGQYSTLS